MRIGIDLRMVGGGSGIARYIHNLALNILQTDKTNQYVLFFRNAEESSDFSRYGHKIVLADIPHYSVAEQLSFPGILRSENLDLVHFPHFNVPLFYTGKFVVTIHDLTHTKYPGRKKSHLLHRLAYNLVLRSAISRAKKIIAVSESTKKEILEYFPSVQGKIEVVYEGTADTYKVMDKEEAFKQSANRFGITKPFILYVGVWRRYKNLPALARAFDNLVDRGVDCQLVLAGKPDPFYPEIEQSVRSIKHKDRLRTPGYVSDEDLNLLYNAASLFVLPSKHEGFGLTALEAAACGTPIACSDIPTLREVLGQAAEYFDPDNLDNMTDVMEHIVKHEQRGEELANLALARVRHFSWKKAAEETIGIYANSK